MNKTEKPLLRQTLRHLLALHWQIPHDDLRRKIPGDLEPVEIDGHCWVSLVASEVADLEVASPLPLPAIPAFRQIELRTAVRSRKGLSGVRHLSLDVSSATLVAAMRTMLGIEAIRAEITISSDGAEEPRVIVNGKREGDEPVSCTIVAIASGVMKGVSPGTLENQLLSPERAFTGSLGSLRSIEAAMPELRVARARIEELDERWLWASGLKRPTDEPLAHYAKDLRAEMSAPHPLRE
ncbi:MAG: DUF2071 domain-containing protein [Thermoanaerobaculia bacterium]